MPIESLVFFCLLTVIPSLTPGVPQRPAASPATVIETTSVGAMTVVVRVMTEEKWNPFLDERVQRSPAASGLGAAWKPSDPRWQNARAALGVRMTRLIESYTLGPQISEHIQTSAGRLAPGPDRDAMLAALTGPAGAALVRQQAQSTFVVLSLSSNPKGPAIGSPEWNKQLSDMAKRFAERVGPALPPDDGTHRAEMEKLFLGPAREPLRAVWDFVISNATRQLDTGMNLMLFDNQAMIERDIAKAVGGGK